MADTTELGKGEFKKSKQSLNLSVDAHHSTLYRQQFSNMKAMFFHFHLSDLASEGCFFKVSFQHFIFYT